MKTASFVAMGVSVVLAASVPYLYVTESTFERKQSRLMEAYFAEEQSFESRRVELEARSNRNAERIDVATRRVEELRRTYDSVRRTAQQSSQLVRNLRQRRSDLKKVHRSLAEQIRDIENVTAMLDSTWIVQASARKQHDLEIARLTADLATVEAQHVLTSAKNQRLAKDRRHWEEFEALQSVPRAAARGVVGWAGESLCGGVDIDLWFARPWNQRIGLKGIYLAVDEEAGEEIAFAGLSWQRLLSDTVHFDAWAGPRWSWRSTREENPMDPALGLGLGWTLPKLQLGLGVLAMATPDQTMLGISAGYSQIGRRIDVYQRH